MPSKPKPKYSVSPVDTTAPSSKPTDSVRVQSFGIRSAALGRTRHRPAAQVGLEARRAAAVRYLDVVDEVAEPLDCPVAGVRDGDLDLLARVGRQVDLPLLPAGGPAGCSIPLAGRPASASHARRRRTSGSGRATDAIRASRPGSSPDSARSARGLARVPVRVRQRRPVVLARPCAPRRTRSPNPPPCRRTCGTSRSGCRSRRRAVRSIVRMSRL